jgi:hypothetical protein
VATTTLTTDIAPAIPAARFGPSSFSQRFSPRKLERAAIAGLGLLIIYAIVRNVIDALSRPFWYDELCTWVMTQLPNASAIWAALSRAADGNPPGFYIIEHAFRNIVPREELALRIPSILAFSCTLSCVFVFVRKRAGAVYALLCSAMLLLTPLFDSDVNPDLTLNPFAVEARPYSLVLACFAIALVCYQHAPSWPWMLLMACSLALAGTLHYYAVFALAPIGIAEAARVLRSRQIRWSVWLALLAGLLPLVAFWPLLSYFSRYMGTHFWAEPSLLAVIKGYGRFLHLPIGLGIALTALVSINLLMFVVSKIRQDGAGRPSKAADDELLYEHILILGLVCLPLVILAATKLVHGGMAARYALPAILAFPLAAGHFLKRMNTKAVGAFALLIVLATCYQEESFWRERRWGRTNPGALAENLLNIAGHQDLPVVVLPAMAFLPIVYYTPEKLRSRLSELVDRQKAVVYLHSDSVEAQLLLLRSHVPFQTYPDFDAVARANPAFLVYSDRGSYTLWLNELARKYSVRFLESLAGRTVYLVETGSPSR